MAEPISLDSFRKKKITQGENQPLLGTMIWLSCPKCKTIEYTEIVAPTGRQHSCRTQVDEVEIEVDLRAEVTIVLHNLTRLQEVMTPKKKGMIRKLAAKALDKALQSLKFSEEVYLARLQQATMQEIKPYEGNMEEIKEKLPIKETNSLGLWISEFRYQPEQRFK